MMLFLRLLFILRILRLMVNVTLVNGLTLFPVLFALLVLVLVLLLALKVLAISRALILPVPLLPVPAPPLISAVMISLSELFVSGLPSPLRVRARFVCARAFGESANILRVCRMVASYLSTASRLRWLCVRLACGLARTEL